MKQNRAACASRSKYWGVAISTGREAAPNQRKQDALFSYVPKLISVPRGQANKCSQGYVLAAYSWGWVPGVCDNLVFGKHSVGLGVPRASQEMHHLGVLAIRVFGNV